MAKLEDFIGAAPAQHVDLGPIHHLEYLAHPVDGAAVVVLADADADKTAADQLGEEGQVAPLLQLVARQTDPLQILSETQLHVTVPIHILLLKLFVPRVKKGPLSVLGFYSMYCTIFGRMPGFEPDLLRLKPGVLPMSITHIYT